MEPERIKLDGLEALRWFAAAAIIIYHVARIPNRRPADDVLWIVDYFAYGVPLFYVLSAFAIWYGYSHQVSTWAGVRHFYRRRFFRIAPLFYIVLAFYLVMLRFDVPPRSLITSLTFTLNLVPADVEGIVWASWSIGVEMLFYAIMPLLALFIRNGRQSALFFVAALTLELVLHQAFEGAHGAMAKFGQFSLLNYLFFFAGGIAALYAFKRLQARSAVERRRLGRVMIFVSAMAIVCFIATGLHSQPIVRGLWAVTLAALVIGVALSPTRIIVNRVSRALGAASFSLYLLHPVLIGFLERSGIIDWLYAAEGPVGGFLAATAMTFAIVIPASLLSYKFIERPAYRWSGRGAVSGMRRASAHAASKSSIKTPWLSRDRG